MLQGIQIRNVLLTTLGEVFNEIPAANRVIRKMDKVEKFPFASVYLGEMQSSKSAMKGHRDRDQDIQVLIYRAADENLEETFANNLSAFEAAVEAKRKSGDFGSNVKVSLDLAAMEFPKDLGGKAGYLTMRFTCSYTDIVA